MGAAAFWDIANGTAFVDIFLFVLVVLLDNGAGVDVECLGSLDASSFGALGLDRLSFVAVGSFGLLKDANQLFALSRRQVTMSNGGGGSPAPDPLTVLITLPELLMMVMISVVGILGGYPLSSSRECVERVRVHSSCTWQKAASGETSQATSPGRCSRFRLSAERRAKLFQAGRQQAWPSASGAGRAIGQSSVGFPCRESRNIFPLPLTASTPNPRAGEHGTDPIPHQQGWKWLA